ncbi:MAG TPA: ABC transporter permease [Puia sp.]|jgi:ABC-type antimicrobial peptide transport system permease subunit|nr:ABC transporter permease [Puia sp.]
MKKKTPQPPKWATRFLTTYCRPELLEDLQGDLNEYFDRNLRNRGAFIARLIYIIDVLKFLRSYVVRRPSVTNPFNNTFMLSSYIKTSGRSILRSRLFSGINIIGLAVSMSIGLLVIAILSDLFSYDSTLKNKDRIYRVVSNLEWPAHQPMKLASTSWKGGTLIHEEVPAVESMTILRNNFGGDARTGDNTVPVKGFYADNGFFDVFGFPFISGVPSTALKQPHSLVLTQVTAQKLFGQADPIGKTVTFDSTLYTVTGVLQDLPKLSHLHFEALASLSSINTSNTTTDGGYMDWNNCFSNYVYVLLKKNSKPSSFTTALGKINTRENDPAANSKVLLSSQPLKDIPMGSRMANEIGAVFPLALVYVIAGLALVILLSACFNYTNLSIARSLRRSREVGIRKVMGANRSQVVGQFIVESIILSLISLVCAFFIFLVLRGQFLSFHEFLQSAFSLQLTPRVILYFISLAMAVGIIAGVLPAIFYAKINAIQVLKNASSLKVFRHVSFRKALVVVQYTLSLIFITTTVIGYNQYKGFIRFDLGFKTENILNIRLQGNKDEVLAGKLAGLPAVNGISRSLMVSSLGSFYGTDMKYNNPADSAGVAQNFVDGNYLQLHQYSFLAGHNFTASPKNAPETEIIVNEQLIRRFNIGKGNPQKAIGERVSIDNKKLTIVGVLRDFHYGTLDSKIDPTAIRYSVSPNGYLNVKLNMANLPATMTSIATFWKELDKVHPLDAKFYDAQIEEAYSQYAVMLKVIGFIALMAICISSLGLFGMVIYTMEKRVKEVSIRKVLGASEGLLVYLLSRSFLFLLMIAALIALPLTWLFFDRVILPRFVYHQPIGFGEMLIGLFFVGGIAFIMIGIQTLKIVRANPARILKNE